jgi:trigger factor
MNIVQENTAPLEASIKVELKQEDYQEKVSAELKNVQRKVQMPGFRPGKVPFGMVKKLYGKNVLVEEVNKILQEALYKHIQDNKLDILGQPLPDQERAEDIDWDGQTDFTFHFQIGLAPEVELELDSDISVDYHKIMVSDDMVDSYLTDIRRRYGKMEHPAESQEEDVLMGEFMEVDDKQEAVPEGKVNKSNLYIQYVKDQDVRKSLVGLKPGASVVFDVLASVGSETEAAAMLGLKKEELAQHSPLFRFTLESISRMIPAEMNEAFYEKVAPGREIKTEEALREFVREQIGMQYQADVDKHLRNEVMKKLISITNLSLPEKFLKKWLLEVGNEELDAEKVENEFAQAADTFRWQLIENHLIKKYELDVKPEEINSHLEYYFRRQMKQYGQEDPEQEMIDGFIKNISSNKDEIKKVYDHLFEEKLLKAFKEKLNLKEIEMGFDEFVTLVTEKYAADKAQNEAGAEAQTESETK